MVEGASGIGGEIGEQGAGAADSAGRLDEGMQAPAFRTAGCLPSHLRYRPRGAHEVPPPGVWQCPKSDPPNPSPHTPQTCQLTPMPTVGGLSLCHMCPPLWDVRMRTPGCPAGGVPRKKKFGRPRTAEPPPDVGTPYITEAMARNTSVLAAPHPRSGTGTPPGDHSGDAGTT